MKFFKSARWFNIDEESQFPPTAQEALIGIPWAWLYYESDPARQRAL